MYFFLPSWYSQGHAWSKVENSWYRMGDQAEFDDTVGQVRLFSKAGAEVTLVVLAYTPCLRQLLHRLGLSGTYYWAVFDLMQGIRRRDIGLFSYQEMGWPAGMEWVYTSLALQGYLHDELFCQLEFGQEGTLLFMDRFQEGKRIFRNYFDDRGFLSSKVFYKDEKPRLQEFYDEAGVCQFKHNLVTDEVKISEGSHHAFARKVYPTMSLLLAEILIGFLGHVPTQRDTLVVAADPRHNSLALLGKKKCLTVLSFYEKRYPLSDVAKLRKEISLCDMVVTDTQILSQGLMAICGWKEGESMAPPGSMGDGYPVVRRPIMDISPYDARLSLGHSQTLRENKVFLPYDGISEEVRDLALREIFLYMSSNPKVVLLVATNLRMREEKEKLRQHFLSLMEEAQVPVIPVDRERAGSSENEDYLGEKEQPRVFFTGYDEEAITQALGDARLVVDVSDHPGLYLQIAAISAGVPQVGFAHSRYVEDRKNGYVIRSVEELQSALSYFLDGLSNWNRALVYSLEKIAAYTDGRIAQRWSDALDAARFGRDQ